MSDKPHGAEPGHDAHGHHGSVFIQHHYDDAQHQFDSGKLGIWLFLAQEVLFFSALFVAYVLYRHHHGEIYAYAHKYLDVKFGAINTAVLIFSSLTAAWAVRAAQLKQKNLLIACLALTLLCACAFLGIKYVEYTHKVHEHILFGRYFDPCVSSGGRPLLTKNNNCPGHESSVVWNTATARADAGCFPDYAIDQDERKAGVQASCSVQEVKLHYTYTWATAGGPEKTEGPFFPVSACEKSRKAKLDARSRKLDPIKKKIDDAKKKKQPTTELEAQLKQVEASEKVGTCTVHETPHKPIPEQCPEWRPSSQPQVPVKRPCWRPAFQPAVCPLSYSYTWNAGAQFGGPYVLEDECKKEQKQTAAGLVDGTAPSACKRSNAIGILVEYGGHGHTPPDIRIKAECKGPPPPPPVTADPLADKEQKLELGKAQATGFTGESKADAKERNYAGPPPPHTNMFFTIYFAMTGLHGIHVLVGVFVFIWLLIRAIKGQFSPDYFGPIDYAALYWHIVDLIWIFLFPLLYLIH